jgi:hypothetical protein
MRSRSPTYQTVAWFLDLARNNQLDLDPPYQRLSFWNQTYRDFFIDTLLNDYPMPAVFLYHDIDREGRGTYRVVDGKQRLETILMYALRNEFPTPSSYAPGNGRYFKDLSDDLKRQVWEYPIPVESIPDTKESFLQEIFDRINRNVAKLRHQELRHARFDGAFAELAERMASQLHAGFPNISEAERRRMRDVEHVAQLLILLGKGPVSTSQDDIDQIYSDWDGELPEDQDLEGRFLRTQALIARLIKPPTGLASLARSRFRNLADHYSLFGAVAALAASDWVPAPATAEQLVAFATRVEDARRGDTTSDQDATAHNYYEATRSASNDRGPREARIQIVKDILSATPVATY